jgi:hypothetical protein
MTSELEEDARKDLRQIRIKKPEDVRNFQARFLRAAVRDGGTQKVNDAYKLIQSSAILMKSIEICDLNKRIQALEKASRKGRMILSDQIKRLERKSLAPEDPVDVTKMDGEWN